MRIYSQLLSMAMDSHNDCLFDFYYDMPEDYKPIFEKKFLLRFGYRNISFDSYQMFKRMLESRLNELMPRYLKLYESENVEYNPFVNTRVKNSSFIRNKGRRKDYETANSKNHNYNNSSGSDSATSTGGTTSGFNENSLTSRQTLDKQRGIDEYGDSKLNLFADTPQTQAQTEGGDGGGDGAGASEKYFNDGFITTATRDRTSGTKINAETENGYAQDASEKGNSAYSTSGDSSDSVSQSKQVGGGQIYTDREVVAADQRTQYGDGETEGLSGVLTSDAIMAWRRTFINIDKELLDELEDLFMGVF